MQYLVPVPHRVRAVLLIARHSFLRRAGLVHYLLQADVKVHNPCSEFKNWGPTYAYLPLLRGQTVLSSSKPWRLTLPTHVRCERFLENLSGVHTALRSSLSSVQPPKATVASARGKR